MVPLTMCLRNSTTSKLHCLIRRVSCFPTPRRYLHLICSIGICTTFTPRHYWSHNQQQQLLPCTIWYQDKRCPRNCSRKVAQCEQLKQRKITPWHAPLHYTSQIQHVTLTSLALNAHIVDRCLLRLSLPKKTKTPAHCA